MPSDRARISYDPSRHYRSVVAQQGRVTLEADWNEAAVIAGEELRAETLDIVGAAGTPDDGYRVQEGSIAGSRFDFWDGNPGVSGTMYVGGERVIQAAPVQYTQQSEWLDHSTDPRWVDPATVGQRDNPVELIYLYLREQEVGAVEDTPLKDVALGGPDTDDRTRIVQHVARIPTTAKDCAGAMAEAAKQWATKFGQDFDLAGNSMRLLPSCKLKVAFTQPVTTGTLCEPNAKGGYLGAENQLIRVRIAGVAAGGAPILLWAYNNASDLYRVDIQPAGSRTLHLQQRPVDDYHIPRAGQVVEVLRTEVDLGNKNYIAADTGVLFTLTSDYDPGTQTLTLPADLPADYQDTVKTPQLFLRLWDAQVTADGGGTAELKTGTASTGLTVTLQPGDAGYETGAFWQIAVRPSTPAEVYPHRYLDDFQPPDGPREWACPLAVVTWQNNSLVVLEDCRSPFDNLVDLTRRHGGNGCCTILVTVADVKGGTGLQSVIDKTVGKLPVTVCLAPGTYSLPAPLKLGARHANLTLTACHGGVTLQATGEKLEPFLNGLIQMADAPFVTISGVEFQLPQVPFTGTTATLGGTAPAAELAVIVRELFVGIGIRPVNCNHLTVEDCVFTFPPNPPVRFTGVGIFGGGDCRGHVVRSNVFACATPINTNQALTQTLIGYMVDASIQLQGAAGGASALAAGGGTVQVSWVDETEIRENRFTNLLYAGAILAELGDITIEDNTASGGYAGFLLYSLRSSVTYSTLNTVLGAKDAAPLQDLAKAVTSVLLDPAFLHMGVLAKLYPSLELAAQPNRGLIQVAAGDVVKHTQIMSDRLQTVTTGLGSILRSGVQISGVAGTVSAVGAAGAAGAAAGTPPAGTAPGQGATQPAGTAAGQGTTAGTGASGQNVAATNIFTDVAVTGFQVQGESAIYRNALETLHNLAQAGLANVPPEQLLHLSLRFAGNELTLLPGGEGNGGSGLQVFHQVADIQGAATISANTIRTRSGPQPVVGSTLVEFVSITGNVLLNEASPGNNGSLPGLTVWSTPFGASAAALSDAPERFPVPIAITGNVIRGLLTAPARNQPAPLNVWDILNTVFII